MNFINLNIYRWEGGRDNGGGPSGSEGAQGRCACCGELGHPATDCPARRAALNRLRAAREREGVGAVEVLERLDLRIEEEALDAGDGDAHVAHLK